MLDEGALGEIIDVFADVKNVLASVNEQGEIMMKGDLNAGMLARSGEGEIVNAQKSLPIEVSLAADRNYIGAVCDGEMQVVSATRVPNKNEVCVTLSLAAKILKNESVPVVSGMSISNEETMRDPKTAMFIYFAKAGEDAFDIAKRYNTSYRAVMEQNSLEDSVLNANKKILIPITR